MFYHWTEDGRSVSTRELVDMIKTDLDTLPPSDPAHAAQQALLQEISLEYPEDMPVFDILVLDDGNIIRQEYYTGWFQEEAEKRAREMRQEERATYPAAYWQVLRIKN